MTDKGRPSDAEWRVLLQLFQFGPSTIGALEERLKEIQDPVSLPTVKTAVRRMLEKGFISKEIVRGSAIYEASGTIEEWLQADFAFYCAMRLNNDPKYEKPLMDFLESSRRKPVSELKLKPRG